MWPGELKEANYEDAAIAAELELDQRVECFTEQPAFVNFKDTKADFTTGAAPKEVPVRLINPAKSQLGRVAKIKLQRLNAQVRSVTQVNQWRQTSDTLQ